ncbi:hypothetical protein [Arthrobacter sp. R4-81]
MPLPAVPIDNVVHYVSASTSIAASRRQVWQLIKPAENAILVDPDIVRGFSSPSRDDVREIQVFISMRDGLEQVSAIEVVEEIPFELAVTRSIGATEDPSARGRDFLRETSEGATILEHGQYFTLPLQAQGQLKEYELHYREFCWQYVERVKAIMEGTITVSLDGQ